LEKNDGVDAITGVNITTNKLGKMSICKRYNGFWTKKFNECQYHATGVVVDVCCDGGIGSGSLFVDTPFVRHAGQLFLPI
jgi:hypothetical protein